MNNPNLPEQPAAPTPVACSDLLEHTDRLAILTAKIERGDGLAMAERLERQGLIFNHAGPKI